MKRIWMGILAGMAALLLTAGALADTAVIDGGSADRVHLRSGASTQHSSLGLFFTGTTVETAEASGEWFKVTIGAQTGYMMSRYLTFGSAAASVTPRQPGGRVLANRVNLRSMPSRRGAVVTQMSVGQAVTLLGETHDKWYYVRYGDSVGYVMAQYVEQTATGMSATDPAMEAEDFAAYRAVLRGETTLMRVEDGAQVFMRELDGGMSSASVTMSRMALVDVDGDGRREVLLTETVNGEELGVAILDRQGGTVLGCELSYRACSAIKADGTFSFASSAAEGGFGHMTLTPSPVMVPLGETTLSARGDVVYHVNGAVCDERTYQRAVSAQEAKAAPAWTNADAALITQ